MKIHLVIVTIVLSTSVPAAENPENLVSLTLDNTTICIPSEYAPGLSRFGQWLNENVKGLDNSGESESILLPAKLIMDGVPGYSFSHINKYNVDLEHTIRGIAHNLSNVGNPSQDIPCDDEYDLGYCYQSVIYKDIYFQYMLKTFEKEHKEEVKKYLYLLFEKWESNCENNG